MATLHRHDSTLNVRMVPAEALESFVDPKQREAFEREYGRVDLDTRADLLALLGLASAIAGRGRKGWEKEVRDTLLRWAKNYENEEGNVPIYFDWRRWAEDYKRFPLMPIVNIEMNRGIRKARFIVWWVEDERRFAPGLLCEDAGAALYGLALSHIGEPGALSICLRCGNPFFRVRRGQSYCNYRCQAAAGMARLRKRQKGAKKSRKTSTRKGRR